MAEAVEKVMADYADGDEQLQDAFEEGNGEPAQDEVSADTSSIYLRRNWRNSIWTFCTFRN